MMLRLQELGCHNINFVTPSHVVPQILEALLVATERGRRLRPSRNAAVAGHFWDQSGPLTRKSKEAWE
jgi:hypothetical protein